MLNKWVSRLNYGMVWWGVWIVTQHWVSWKDTFKFLSEKIKNTVSRNHVPCLVVFFQDWVNGLSRVLCKEQHSSIWLKVSTETLSNGHNQWDIELPFKRFKKRLQRTIHPAWLRWKPYEISESCFWIIKNRRSEPFSRIW